MCGIVGLVCFESVPSFKTLHQLFVDATSRGSDGFGLYISDPDGTFIISKKCSQYDVNDSDPDSNEFLKLCKNLKIGSVLLAISRNAPETEELTTIENMQPIVIDDCVLVHNGAISEEDVNRYKDKKQTDIDSEVILLSYLEHQKNIVRAIEDISGGWSFIIHDRIINKLIIGTSFIPLAHEYLKGIGYIIHSLTDSVSSAAKYELNHNTYTRVWEDFYIDEIPPYNVLQIDLDSGLVNEKPYKHKFIHPIWNIKNKVDKDMVLVCASGGIDSTLQLILSKKLFKKDVTAVHFKYGQKSQEAELLSIQNITDELEIPLIVIDLSDMFKQFSSMLINDDIQVTTGSFLKTTLAWVPNRNGVFLNCILALAENLILENKYNRVFICAGLPVISEESVYPDNSSRFINSFQEYLKFSTLCGSHNKIIYLNLCQGLTKAEELILYDYFKLSYLFSFTISCDKAIVDNGIVKQCSKNGIPACGSGLLSWWASKKAGITDNRVYYEIEDNENELYIPNYIKNWNDDNTIYYDDKTILDKVVKIAKDLKLI